MIWSVSAHAATQCLPPTPAESYINPLTGDIDLRWIGGSQAKTYTLKILHKGKSCLDPATDPGEKEITIDGSLSTYKINDADLDCGKWQYCLQAECCDDSCEACTAQGKVPKDAEYCITMAGLMGDPCACTDPNYPLYRSQAEDGFPSFHFKCSDGKVYHAGFGCPIGTKIVGCYWDCVQATADVYKRCGTDYEVKCGTVNKKIVNAKASYNLCSVSDGRRGFKTDDSYLLKPPGVVDSPEPPFGYTWACVGKNPPEQCVACRQAICNPAYQDHIFSDVPNSSDLCRDSDGTITGQVQNFHYDETLGKWLWDCVGRADCNADASTPNKASCSSSKAGCGIANGKFYTLGNFHSKASGDISFLCLNGGYPSQAGFEHKGGGWVDEFHYRYTDPLTGITTDYMAWECVYPPTPKDPNPIRIGCSAHIIDCQASTQGKNLTKDNWTANYSVDNNKLCHNGLDNVFTQGTVDTSLGDFKWACKDNYGGSTSCSANGVECQKPPHDSYVDDFTDLFNTKVCTAGKVGNFWQIEENFINWSCLDDDGWNVNCFSQKLACAKPPSGRSFADFDELKASGNISCTGTGTDLDPYQCTGVCNDPAKRVEVVFANNQWTWTCGQDNCLASILDCARPPANDEAKKIYQYYDDLPSFKLFVESHDGRCDGVSNNEYDCTGVCTDKTYRTRVTMAGGKFTWSCGKKPCEAFQPGCASGENSLNGKGPLNAASFIRDSANPDNLCANGGTVVWYDKYNKPENGFTPYGNGELSGGRSHAFEDVNAPGYKEGSWLWQCSYPGGKIYPKATDNTAFPWDGKYYCYNDERGECGDTLRANQYTLNELKGIASDSNQRGNAFNSDGVAKLPPILCQRGTQAKLNSAFDPTLYPTYIKVYNDPWTIDFVDGFGKLPKGSEDTRKTGADRNLSGDYAYWCDGGMNNANKTDSCIVNVKGCLAPPDGGTYTDQTDFDAHGGYACDPGLTQTGGAYDSANCQWTWNCGGDSCSATKDGDFTAPAISGNASICSKDANTYTIDSTKIKDCDPNNITIDWSVTPTDPPVVGSGWSLNIPADTLADGNYTVTAVITCNQSCVKNKTITKTLPIKVEKKIQEGANITASTTTICVGESVTFTAHPDARCTSPKYYWNGNTAAGQPSTFSKTYNQRGTYPAGDVTVTISCDNCYSPVSVGSPAITVDQFEDPTSVEIAPLNLTMCKGDNSPHVFSANPIFVDPNIPDCDNVKYVWRIDNVIKAGNASTFDIAGQNLSAGNHTISVTAQCQDKCSDKTITAQASATITVKEVKPGTIKAAETICSGETPAVLDTDINAENFDSLQWQSAPVSLSGGCPGDNDPSWTDIAGQTGQSYTPPRPTLTETTCFRRVAKSADCGDKYSNTIKITVTAKPDQNASMTVSTSTICVGQSVTFTAHPDARCQNPKYYWNGNNAAGQSNTFSKTYNQRGEYTGDVSVLITCDNCYKDWTGANSKITVNKTYETPGSNLTGPSEACYGSDVAIGYDPTWSTTYEHCPEANRHYAWYVDGVLNSANTGATFNSTTLSTSTHNISLKITCDKPCKTPAETMSTTSVAIYNCQCGSANGKNFVDNDNNNQIDTLSPFEYCNAGCTAVPTPLDFDGVDTWSWHCQCGSGSLNGPNCTAKKTKCGPKSGATNYYVDASWNSFNNNDKCTNGVINNATIIDTGTSDEAGADSNSCNGGIKDTWNWNCQDSASHNVSCTAKRLDCGVADAQRVLDKGCAIQPFDSTDGYRGSYFKDTGVTASHQCNWGSSFSIGYEDTGRGKWWWQCQDSLNATVACEARKDCNWAVRDQTDSNGNAGDGSRYPTVDYGSNGCWTAQDVGKWSDNSVKAMTWGRATKFKISNTDSDPVCATSPLWNNCKAGHCSSQLNNNSCYQDGVCPSGFSLPSDSEWHGLEDSLKIGSSCDPARLGGADKYQCSPAGNDGDTMPDDPADDGLKDPITFYGASGSAYWTKTPKNQGAPNQFCVSGVNCPKTLPYYELNSSDDVGRDAGTTLNSNVTCSGDACLQKNVRCRKAPGTGSVSGGGGGEKKCLGFGCY